MTRERVRVLCIDDSDEDVALELAVLRGGGLDLAAEVVKDPRELRGALMSSVRDLILCAHPLSSFRGLEALEIVHAVDRDVPIIFIARAGGEELAVEAMRAGADDYLLKNNLVRLAAAVERELRDLSERREGRMSYEGLQLLADAGAVLTGSVSVEVAIEAVARLVLGHLGELCVIELANQEGRVHRAAAAHSNPSAAELLGQLMERHPPRSASDAGDGKAVSYDLADADDGIPPAFIDIARALGARCGASVTLKSHSRSEGILCVAGSHAYSPLQVRVLEELGRRVGTAVEAARLLEDARKAIRVRDDFLLVASHELKTPLTAMQLQLQGIEQLAKKSPSELDAARLNNRIARTISSTERLAFLIESLLDVSCVATGRLDLNLETFDLADALDAVADRVREQADRAGSKLTLPTTAHVIGKWDRMRIEQVLTNLLSNAIKYGKGGAIELALSSSDKCAVIQVIDHGIGIRAEDVERIFGRFERAVSARHYGGLGLGLYVTREIVAAHGGRVDARATPGGGATFTVELPLVPPWDHPAPSSGRRA